tara:strand:+ start:553 stop:756 length:204 start_codon:yes stop_codon:yes gene_type:complete
VNSPFSCDWQRANIRNYQTDTHLPQHIALSAFSQAPESFAQVELQRNTAKISLMPAQEGTNFDQRTS